MIVGEAEQEERGGQFFLQSQQIPLQLVVMHSCHRNERITLLVGERGGEAVLVAAVHDDQTVERVTAPRQNLVRWCLSGADRNRNTRERLLQTARVYC